MRFAHLVRLADLICSVCSDDLKRVEVLRSFDHPHCDIYIMTELVQFVWFIGISVLEYCCDGLNVIGTNERDLFVLPPFHSFFWASAKQSKDIQYVACFLFVRWFSSCVVIPTTPMFKRRVCSRRPLWFQRREHTDGVVFCRCWDSVALECWRCVFRVVVNSATYFSTGAVVFVFVRLYDVTGYVHLCSLREVDSRKDLCSVVLFTYIRGFIWTVHQKIEDWSSIYLLFLLNVYVPDDVHKHKTWHYGGGR